MDPAIPFESGYSPVLLLERRTPAQQKGGSWALGRRQGLLRIERGDQDAWEFDDAGRLVRSENHGRWRQYTLDQRSWGHQVVGSASSRRLQPLDTEIDGPTRVRRAHAVARALAGALARGALHVETVRGETGAPDALAYQWLTEAASWDSRRLVEDLERIQGMLLPVPVLPPDQYGALPVQLTEGCSWNRCTFCTLYAGGFYRERSPGQVAALLDELLEHLGPSIARFRRVFLGQANALLLDDDLLHAHLDVIEERLPRVPSSLSPAARRAWIDARPGAIEGFSAFLDAFHRPRPVSGWKRLRERGLLRVHVGVESGSEQRVRALGKPIRMASVEDLLKSLHEAEIPVGLIFLAGIGNVDQEREHREATTALLSRLALRKGDQIFISPLMGSSDTADRHFARNSARHLREASRSVVPSGVPIAEYDLHRLAQRTPRG